MSWDKLVSGVALAAPARRGHALHGCAHAPTGRVPCLAATRSACTMHHHCGCAWRAGCTAASPHAMPHCMTAVQAALRQAHVPRREAGRGIPVPSAVGGGGVAPGAPRRAAPDGLDGHTRAGGTGLSRRAGLLAGGGLPACGCACCITCARGGHQPKARSISPSPAPNPTPAAVRLVALALQHFTTEDGAYYGGNGPFKCSPIPALPAVQRNATVRARVAAGGWYNAGVKPLVPLLGDAHLRTW